MGVPLTVMVSPAAKLVASESVLAAPDNNVAPVIGAGIAALLLTTLPVAVPAGLKKSLPAATAEAATSDVFASFAIAAFSAALRLVAVADDDAPIAKLPTGCGVASEAVTWIVPEGPSGSVNAKLTLSRSLGLVAPRSIETAA